MMRVVRPNVTVKASMFIPSLHRRACRFTSLRCFAKPSGGSLDPSRRQQLVAIQDSLGDVEQFSALSLHEVDGWGQSV
jgi:hypothetical protein